MYNGCGYNKDASSSTHKCASCSTISGSSGSECAMALCGFQASISTTTCVDCADVSGSSAAECSAAGCGYDPYSNSCKQCYDIKNMTRAECVATGCGSESDPPPEYKLNCKCDPCPTFLSSCDNLGCAEDTSSGVCIAIPQPPMPPLQPPMPPSPSPPPPCSPPSPLPSPPSDDTSVAEEFAVSFTVTASGDVSDYTTAVKDAMATKVATTAGVDKSKVEVVVTAASVNVQFTIKASTAAAATAAGAAVQTSVATANATTAFFSTVPGITITVASVTAISAPVSSAVSSGLGGGAIAGIVIGVIAGVAILGTVVYGAIKRSTGNAPVVKASPDQASI